jgi:hypothetical protein
VRHRDLLAAISDLEPVSVEGTFQRHCALRFRDLTPSPAGGRWGAPGAYEVLYLGRPPESVVAEAYRHLVEDELDSASALAAAVLERRLITCEVHVAGVLDVRDPGARAALALGDERLRSEVGDYGHCRAVAGAAHQLGLAGVLAPAASGIGETLALFAANTPIAQWPTVAASEIWRGLPADPRRLREAGSGAESA